MTISTAFFTAHGATIEECRKDAWDIARTFGGDAHEPTSIAFGQFEPVDAHVLAAEDRTIATSINRWSVDCRATFTSGDTES